MTRALVKVAALVVLAACNGSKGTTPPRHKLTEDAGGSADVKMTSSSPGGFVRGAAIAPTAGLIAWLDGQQLDGAPRLVRLPVVLARRGPRFSTAGARVGLASDALTVFLDDSKLGIGLADRARTACKDADTCALWVEGYWRGQQDGDYTFEVRAVRDAITPDAVAAASHAEVEGESGN
jgi:hypothetical protein